MTSPMRHLASCRAVLLDMDGTLVDSGAAVEATWRAWARDNGLDPATVLAVCHGPDAATTVRRFLPGIGAAELARHVAAHLERECADIDGVIPAPGAPELVAWLDERRLPWGVVTNAHLRLARARLGAAGIEAPVIISFDDVEGRGYIWLTNRNRAITAAWLYPDDHALEIQLFTTGEADYAYDQDDIAAMTDLLHALIPAIPPVAARTDQSRTWVPFPPY